MHCHNCKNKCTTSKCLKCDDEWCNFEAINVNGPLPKKGGETVESVSTSNRSSANGQAS